MISERQIQILMTLYNAEGYLTFQDIAGKLNVSVKTVRNDIGFIKGYLSEHQAGSLITKPHAGVKLSVNEPEWEKLCNEMHSEPILLKENANILFAVLYALLKKKSISALHFTNQLYVSKALVDKTLDSAKTWFHDNHILLERKKGKGVEIHYSEYNYRLALWDFFTKFKSLIYESGVARTSKSGTVDDMDYSTITELLDGFDVDGVIEAIHGIELKYGFHYSYSANLRAVLLISLGVMRSGKKLYAAVPAPVKCKTDGTFDDLLLEDLAEALEKRYSIKLPEGEREYIKFVLAISEIQEFKDQKAKRFYQYRYVELCRFTVKFINLCSEISNIQLKEDRFFVEQVFLQLKTMIERLKYHVGFKNPLLRQIKSKYPNTMAMAWAACNMIEKELELDINEQEVGFLALHIGGAIERRTSFLKACIVCDYGIGISQLLKEKIERTISDLKVIGVLSNRDIRSIRDLDCDIIISTLPLEEARLNKPVIVVGHLLLPLDIKNLETTMKQIKKNKLRTGIKTGDIGKKQRLFHKDLLYINLETSDKEELLRLLCSRLENLGYVTEGFENSVLERERSTSTEVGKGIALPHGQTKYVNRSVVSVATLNQPIVWFDDSKVDLVFLLAFDLDEGKGMKDEIIKFYKSFVMFLDNDENIRQLKQSSDEKELMHNLDNF